MVEKLRDAARRAGVKIPLSAAERHGLVMRGRSSSEGVEVVAAMAAPRLLDADAVILATGGFQGNAAMMRTQFGPRRRDH